MDNQSSNQDAITVDDLSVGVKDASTGVKANNDTKDVDTKEKVKSPTAKKKKAATKTKQVKKKLNSVTTNVSSTNQVLALYGVIKKYKGVDFASKETKAIEEMIIGVLAENLNLELAANEKNNKALAQMTIKLKEISKQLPNNGISQFLKHDVYSLPVLLTAYFGEKRDVQDTKERSLFNASNKNKTTKIKFDILLGEPVGNAFLVEDLFVPLNFYNTFLSSETIDKSKSVENKQVFKRGNAYYVQETNLLRDYKRYYNTEIVARKDGNGKFFFMINPLSE